MRQLVWNNTTAGGSHKPPEKPHSPLLPLTVFFLVLPIKAIAFSRTIVALISLILCHARVQCF